MNPPAPHLKNPPSIFAAPPKQKPLSNKKNSAPIKSQKKFLKKIIFTFAKPTFSFLKF